MVRESFLSLVSNIGSLANLNFNSNDADLRMISEMGVKPRDRTQTRSPRQKLKTAVSMVKAAVRMQRMGREWKKTKKLGEGLKRAKNDVLKRRDSSNNKELVE